MQYQSEYQVCIFKNRPKNKKILKSVSTVVPSPYTVEKDQSLRAIIKAIPRNATYTSPVMLNKLIAAISSVINEDFKQETRNSRYTINVDGTKDPSGVENILIIIRFFSSIF